MRFEKPYRPAHGKSCDCHECSMAFRLRLSLRLDFALKQEDVVNALTVWTLDYFGKELPLTVIAELEAKKISTLIDERALMFSPLDAKQQSFLLDALSRQQDVVEGLTRYFPDGVRQSIQGENNGEESCSEEAPREQLRSDGVGV